MIRKIFLLFILSGSICCGQTNKTLKDTVFKRGDIVKIPEIIFTLSYPIGYPGAKDSIDLIGEFLVRHKNLVVEIACHTDSRGTPEMNMHLSEARAKAIHDYLIEQYKLDPAFVKFKGYGESKPIIPDDEIRKVKTREQQENKYAINRRTELLILDVK